MKIKLNHCARSRSKIKKQTPKSELESLYTGSALKLGDLDPTLRGVLDEAIQRKTGLPRPLRYALGPRNDGSRIVIHCTADPNFKVEREYKVGNVL